jgi:flagellar basal-body rod protein FlgC
MSGFDALFSGLRASSSGLSAERLRMDVIAENVANARTTKTAAGGPYTRRIVRFEPLLQEAFGRPGRVVGVKASAVSEDRGTPYGFVHEPGHPDADANGYVEYPNVNTILEMTDLITAMRSYEANLTVQQNFIQMAERALQLAR